MKSESKSTHVIDLIDEDYYISELIQQKGSYGFGILLDKLSDSLAEKEQLCTFRKWAIRLNAILKKSGVFSLSERMEIIKQRWYEGYILQSSSWFRKILYKTRNVHYVISALITFLPFLAGFNKDNVPNKVSTLGLILSFINFFIIQMSHDYSQKKRPKCAFLICMLINISVAAISVVVFSFPYWFLKWIIGISVVYFILQIFTWLRKHEEEYEVFSHMLSEQDKEHFISNNYS